MEAKLRKFRDRGHTSNAPILDHLNACANARRALTAHRPKAFFSQRAAACSGRGLVRAMAVGPAVKNRAD
jgi:hypothetical protein